MDARRVGRLRGAGRAGGGRRLAEHLERDHAPDLVRLAVAHGVTAELWRRLASAPAAG